MRFKGFYVTGTVEFIMVIVLVLVCEALLYAFHCWTVRRAARTGADPLEVRSSYSSLLVLGLSWVLILVVGFAWLNEGNRMAAAQAFQTQEQTTAGAQMFASYCVPCHGPQGEGVIGAPLNQPSLRGNPSSDVTLYQFLVTTISDGRPGYPAPTWVRVNQPNGQWYWQSETAMPYWAQSQNGPLTIDQIDDLAKFLMEGNWNSVISYIPPGNPSGSWPAPTASTLPLAQQQAAQRTIDQIGCLSCHTIGQRGQKIAPDITNVDKWGVSKQFVYDWIANPPLVSQQQHRAPTHWNMEFANKGGSPLPYGQPQVYTLPPTFMPKLNMTPAQRQLIVNYLFSMK
jgi:mono/diheme cytochrome c family protein